MVDHDKDLDSGKVLARIGAELAARRRERDLKIADIAETLRIQSDHISAIEKGDSASLPAMTYVMGYVRSYASLVGADGAELCRRLRESLSENEIKPQYDFIQNKASLNSNAGLAALAALVGCVFLYAGWYVIDIRTIPSGPEAEQAAELVEDAQDTTLSLLDEELAEAPEAPADETQVAASDTSADAPAVTSLPVAPASDAATAAKTAETASARPETRAEKSDAVKPAAAEQSAAITDATPATATPVTETPITATQAMATGRVPDKEMTIHALATSWVEITRADGSTVSAWLMQKDEQYTIPGGDDLYLTAGNAGGLEITLGQGEKFLLGEWGETVQEMPLDAALIKTRP